MPLLIYLNFRKIYGTVFQNRKLQISKKKLILQFLLFFYILFILNSAKTLNEGYLKYVRSAKVQKHNNFENAMLSWQQEFLATCLLSRNSHY